MWQAASAAIAEERAWGDALVSLHGALLQGRRFVWEEASRKIGILALSPAALQAEHLVQVQGKLACAAKNMIDEGNTACQTEAISLHRVGRLRSQHALQAG